MKVTLVLSFCLLCALGAFGQVAGAVIPPMMNSVGNFTSHPMHASQGQLATEQNLLGESTVTWAQGERPLWEFAHPEAQDRPLGDIARELRKEHLAAKKANAVHENQP